MAIPQTSATTERGIETLGSLPECHAYCLKEMANPPALITLKKWSASGVLDSAKRRLAADLRGSATAKRKRGTTQKSQGKVRYAMHAVLAIAEERLRFTINNGVQAPASPDRRRPGGEAAQHDEVATAAMLDALATKLSKSVTDAVSAGVASHSGPGAAAAAAPSADLAALLAKTTDAIASLENTRRQMMVKYDAELQMWKQKCADLQAQNAALKASASQIDVMKTNILLNNILDRVNNR